MKKTIITLLILASLGFVAYRYYPVVFSKKEVKQSAMAMSVDVVEVRQKDFYPSFYRLRFIKKYLW